MGLKITIGITGVPEVNRTLAIRMDRVKDLRPAWDKIEKVLMSFQKKVFLGKGAASYTALGETLTTVAWKALSSATVKYKQRHFPKWANSPLIRTEKLMRAFTQSGDPVGAIRMKEPLVFVYGIDDAEIPYAKYHHLGGSKLPKRPVLRVPDNMKKVIVKSIQAHLAKTGQLERETVFG